MYGLGVSERLGLMTKPNRRHFLTSVAGAATVGSTGLSLPQRAKAAISGPINRKQRAYDLRVGAAEYFRAMPDAKHHPNGDEELYPDKRNSFAKTLPHDEMGLVRQDAWDSLMKAVDSGRTADYESILMGGSAKLVSPQAAHSFNLEGLDTHQLLMRPAPAFASPEQAAEMVELYWQSLARDVPFAEYETNDTIRAAAEDLSRMSDFRGPKAGGRVTASTVFRAGLPGDREGPYLSQFLAMPVASGATKYDQKIRTVAAGVDYLTAYPAFLNAQRGSAASQVTLDPVARYIRNARDLAEWVHRDYSYQAFLNAALILFELGDKNPGALGEVRTFSDNNVLLYSRNQAGFVTWGVPDITDLLARVSKFAFQAAWCQKWLVHRRARPEEFGGHVHNHMTARATYPIHADLQNSPVLKAVHDKQGSYLLAQAFPEGTPAHPAYPSGHATVSGACATVLKAFFREDFIIPNPVIASSDGLEMRPYLGAPLTVGGEINKLVSNIAIGRDWAGIHWRTDMSEGIKLGEEVAIQSLRDFGKQYSEDFGGFTFNRFDGTEIMVCPGC